MKCTVDDKRNLSEPFLSFVPSWSWTIVNSRKHLDYITSKKFRRDKLSDKNLSESLFAENIEYPKVCHAETFFKMNFSKYEN